MEAAVLIPVYNDWEALRLLLMQLEKENIAGKVLVVNDGSLDNIDKSELTTTIPLTILHLNRNVGHQKAIAIGLSHLAVETTNQPIVIMDADGEDDPADIQRLLERHSQTKNRIIFAKRIKRSEGVLFSLFYWKYKQLYKLLTGSKISFGNFCVIPAKILPKVALLSEIASHFSSGVVKSKIPYETVPVNRGKRLTGQSKMNVYSLMLHGLSAISVHTGIVAVRLLIACVFLIVASMIGIAIVVGVKYTTDMAIPGWATYVTIGLVTVSLQALLMSVFLAFTTINYNNQRKFIPLTDYKNFLLRIE